MGRLIDCSFLAAWLMAVARAATTQRTDNTQMVTTEQKRMCRLFRKKMKVRFNRLGSTEEKALWKTNDLAGKIVCCLFKWDMPEKKMPSSWKQLYVSINARKNEKGLTRRLNQLVTNKITTEWFCRKAVFHGDFGDPEIMKLNERIEKDAMRRRLLHDAYSMCPECHQETLRTTKSHRASKGSMGSKGSDTYTEECVNASCRYHNRVGY